MKKTAKSICTVILIIVMVCSNTLNISAAAKPCHVMIKLSEGKGRVTQKQKITTTNRTKKFSCKWGGTYTLTGLDNDYLKKNPSARDFALRKYGSYRMTEIVFLSPKQTQSLWEFYARKCGKTSLSAPLSFFKTSLINYGKDKAIEKVKEKYGAEMLGKINPYISIFLYSRSIINVVKNYNDGEMEQFLYDARDTGVVFERVWVNGLNSTLKFKWEKSFGNYPYARPNPEQFQVGTFTYDSNYAPEIRTVTYNEYLHKYKSKNKNNQLRPVYLYDKTKKHQRHTHRSC